ncbi:hypothetical protein MMC09_004911 [Bachmanniomyces sp. S44760]|nr:hypothetical protein [Bachmanniomyces sp. S44760]
MSATLQINLVNNTSSTNVFAFVTGLAIDNNNAWFLLSADGKTPYYPPSPASVGTAVAQDCAIKLGSPGATTSIAIPHIAGGRIYLSVDTPLTFLLNPGPALVEPSVTNTSDANINIDWGFCEFTWNSDQLYANISYVDFVSLPIALNLTTSSGAAKQVLGLPANGLDTICSGLVAQSAADNQGWSSLIVKGPNGQNLRVLSPNQGIVMNGSLFSGYFEPYVDQVWSKYTITNLQVDTQASFGVVQGEVSNNQLQLSGEGFVKPSTHDIFNASSGPFATGSDAKRNAIIPRLNAEMNRSTLLTSTAIPAPLDQYYKNPVTNHYARLCHATNLDGRGYAHPYDDVAPSGGPDQSGFVNDGAPKLLTITVGGPGQGGMNVQH